MSSSPPPFPYAYWSAPPADPTDPVVEVIIPGVVALGVPTQSATAPALATAGTISTAGVSVARVSPTSAVTGVILQAGTTPGQQVTVINEAVAANTVTFAAAGTSSVADGVGTPIVGLTARTFIWDSITSLWYRSI